MWIKVKSSFSSSWQLVRWNKLDDQNTGDTIFRINFNIIHGVFMMSDDHHQIRSAEKHEIFDDMCLLNLLVSFYREICSYFCKCFAQNPFRRVCLSQFSTLQRLPPPQAKQRLFDWAAFLQFSVIQRWPPPWEIQYPPFLRLFGQPIAKHNLIFDLALFIQEHNMCLSVEPVGKYWDNMLRRAGSIIIVGKLEVNTLATWWRATQTRKIEYESLRLS